MKRRAPNTLIHWVKTLRLWFYYGEVRGKTWFLLSEQSFIAFCLYALLLSVSCSLAVPYEQWSLLLKLSISLSLFICVSHWFQLSEHKALSLSISLNSIQKQK